MHSRTKNLVRRLRAAGAVGAVLTLGGCLMQSQSAPALTGPSGFGQALTLTATPDTLARDGSSQSVIRVNYRDGATNEALVQQRLILSVSSGTLSVSEVVTDSGGNASFTLIAPSLNTPVSTVAVTATAVGLDAASAVSKKVLVALIGPAVPSASFTTTPSVPAVAQAVTYDASGTTLGGSSCGASCSYDWDFGDGGTASGQVVQHTFQSLGVKVVTLTVSAPGGTAGTTSKAFSMATPAAPTAAFTAPSPTAGQQATFDASASTVGSGARIVQYAWNFGDAGVTNQTATVPIVVVTYPTPGIKVVTLTVTDDLGRSASKTASVTVAP